MVGRTLKSDYYYYYYLLLTLPVTVSSLPQISQFVCVVSVHTCICGGGWGVEQMLMTFCMLMLCFDVVLA